MSFHMPESSRVATPDPFDEHGVAQPKATNGGFLMRSPHDAWALLCLASDGFGWEHVSVHALLVDDPATKRVPTWGEMCYIKSLFWDDEDTVVQFHPSASNYVNDHPYTLHLWRPTKRALPTPPPSLVGRLTCETFKG